MINQRKRVNGSEKSVNEFERERERRVGFGRVLEWTQRRGWWRVHSEADGEKKGEEFSTKTLDTQHERFSLSLSLSSSSFFYLKKKYFAGYFVEGP